VKTLKQFAEASGVIVGRCDRVWGGTWEYTLKDHPNTHYCGYRTESALYKAWAIETFGKGPYEAIIKLLKK
jgi:hypothetical protein